MPLSQFNALQETAERAARAAGAAALRHFRCAPEVERKADGSFVTAADREAELAARAVIATAHPSHTVVGEEFGADSGGYPTGPAEPGAPPRWWIDPIDGTHNYLRGNHLFAALVAVEIGPEIVAGAVYNPVLDEMLSAARGAGCRCNGETARVSTIADLAEAQLVHGGFDWIERHERGPRFLELARRCWRTRGFGDYFGHVLVAAGRAEIMVELRVKPWDLAAIQIIVEEAGGRFTDIDGRRTIYGGSALATNGRLHDEVLHLLAVRDRRP